MYFLPRYKRGIFNRYRKGMPWTEMLSKDVSRLFFKLRLALKGQRPIRMLIYPHLPSRGASIYRIARFLGIELSNKPEGRYDLAFYWEYATHRKEWHLLEQRDDLTVINLHSRNIAKDYLDECMKEVFGYGAAIDPETHQGVAVKKSVINALHDGQIVECPTKPEAGFQYMKLVDSRVSEEEVMDIRTPVMKGEIPHVCFVYRPADQRFLNVPPRAVLEMNVDAAYSAEEQKQIIALAEKMGMEYCELDILRDKDDKRIYVVDANNTAQGPPLKLTAAEKQRAIESYSSAFKRQFLANLPKS